MQSLTTQAGKNTGLQNILSTLVLTLVVTFGSCQKHNGIHAPQFEPVNENYSKKDTINSILRAYTAKGLPGLAVAVYTDTEKWWETASGFSSLETKTPMLPSQLHYLQSISKTYMAVGILKLWEEGRINLDAAITSYLPARFAVCVSGAGRITVRNLLNHTSGIADYTGQPAYVSYLIQHPDHRFTAEELMNYIKGGESLFTPGSKFSYSNTNFELHAFIADSITGNHASYLYEKIIRPLQLTHTWYRYDKNYPNYADLTESYLDRNSNGSIENISLMQKVNVSSMVGDDGFIASPRDALRFLKGLFDGKLLSAPAMRELTNWVKDENGENVQGMGLYYLNAGGIEGYGHGGSGIGAGCGLYYFPSRHLYVFMGTNLGTIIEGPLVDQVNELKQRLLAVLLQ